LNSFNVELNEFFSLIVANFIEINKVSERKLHLLDYI